MGYYDPSGSLNFEGTMCEKQMMQKLLQIMDVIDPENEYELPADFDGFVSGFPLPLLGVLGGSDSEKSSFYLLSYKLEFAPRLFAALFPNSSFHYIFTPWYSVTMDDTETITAIYKDRKLMIRLSYYNSKRAESLCRKFIEQNENAHEKYEEYIRKEGLEDDPEAVDWFDVLRELSGRDGKEVVDESYDFFEDYPLREEEYEKSFFLKDDLQVYLVGEQIKNKDMSLADYIKEFSFTQQQLQYFIEIAADCRFAEMASFLLEEKQCGAILECRDSFGSAVLPKELNSTPSKTDFSGKIFVLTGFDQKMKDRITKIIKSKGGIIKSSTVLQTDYLIYDPRDGINTVKHKRAIELNGKGKNIIIITGPEFLRYVK